MESLYAFDEIDEIDKIDDGDKSLSREQRAVGRLYTAACAIMRATSSSRSPHYGVGGCVQPPYPCAVLGYG